MPTADLGDVSLHYRTWNDDPLPRVLYVGGSGSDLRNFPNPADIGFDEGAHLLAYDHRGLGQSTSPGQPAMADFARDLVGLLDHAGWDTCAMVGISFGGMVALEAAVTWPERFDRVVLGCTSPGGELPSFPLHTLIDCSMEERAERWLDLLDTRHATDAERRAVVKSLLDSRPQTPQTTGEKQQLLARAHHDVQSRIGTMTMPVLIAAGRYDGIATPDNQEWLHANLPNSELRWFDGGHAFFFDDRSAVPAMRAFLTGG